ncbi:MAG: hypothetical protein JOZ22_10140 [Acidobacteriia bacterium]|nr:hypothetical protein [Terriglobia bacterium]
MLIEQLTRDTGERWVFQEYRDPNGTVPLISLAPLSLGIADIYQGVND